MTIAKEIIMQRTIFLSKLSKVNVIATYNEPKKAANCNKLA